MKTNHYYAATLQRKTAIRDYTIFAYLFFVSLPRLLLEVFIRKNFGRRYFSIVSAIAVFIILFFIPIGIEKFAGYESYGISYTQIIFKNITWYIFLAGFVYCCYKRQQEISYETSVFDTDKFTLYSGNANPRFYDVKIKGKPATRRQIATMLEPLFFFAIGLVLTIMMQKVGALLIFCSFCYSTGWIAAYNQGDHFIMDMIDKMISNEELASSFVDGRKPEQTRGFETICGSPSDPEMRRKIFGEMMPDDEVSIAY